MTRYEGMEELLQRVRQQLKVDESKQPKQTQRETVFPVPREDERFVMVLEQVLVLLRQVDQVCTLLGEEQIPFLNKEQGDDLSRLLTKGLNQLRDCASGLQRAVHQP